jgi:hypothetical protein
MLMRNPAAARAASSAVTGPCTTEYGPRIAGKKKIDSTQITATSASAPSIRLSGMGISTIIRCPRPVLTCGYWFPKVMHHHRYRWFSSAFILVIDGIFQSTINNALLQFPLPSTSCCPPLCLEVPSHPGSR